MHDNAKSPQTWILAQFLPMSEIYCVVYIKIPKKEANPRN